MSHKWEGSEGDESFCLYCVRNVKIGDIYCQNDFDFCLVLSKSRNLSNAAFHFNVKVVVGKYLFKRSSGLMMEKKILRK